MNDARMDRLIAVLLRVGVLLAAAVVLAGGLWRALAAGDAAPDLRAFHGEPAAMSSPRGVLDGIAHGRPEALIQLGLLLLIATPVARVALSAAAFALRRDRLYLAITLTVLAVLLAALAGIGGA